MTPEQARATVWPELKEAAEDAVRWIEEHDIPAGLQDFAANVSQGRIAPYMTIEDPKSWKASTVSQLREGGWSVVQSAIYRVQIIAEAMAYRDARSVHRPAPTVPRRPGSRGTFRPGRTVAK